ncbi:transcription initiation factor TFIID [Paenibacillus sp. HJL G12]|uniref:Transcription initiation factor TFIID n=1 Tax=Paenibacillus dendrobii TaxID=2691084 RepID=A0A7X3LHL3_9BACL|nr:transcription initiation factor TFIID [Paenibacillus dendrobii]MWV45936.1 transcription initiation factor TFIID [Paenibacillus dendrobii]
MDQLLERFAANYAADQDQLSGKGDDQSSIHYPAVFLFIGDKSAGAIEPMMSINHKKWDNSAGVMYFHVGTGAPDRNVSGIGASEQPRSKVGAAQSGPGTPDTEQRLSRFVMRSAPAESDVKTLRKELYQSFYRDEEQLYGLNRALRQLSYDIADYGRLYSSFDRIHLSVITRVDDPLNVFIPEVSLLAQSIFSQSFKSVQMDLYVLISERDQMEAFGYGSSAGVAFLREVELMQSPDYSFSAKLHVTEDGLSIPVTHQPAPLFDLAYVLSDKNERGISAQGGMQGNYEIICHLSLLKNRKQKDSHYDMNTGGYNNTSFKNNIMTESGRQGYVSAGFSRVKRPNESIALAVLYHFYSGLLQRMKRLPDWGMKEKVSFFGLDPASVSERAAKLVPDSGKIAEMTGMMTHPVSYGSLKRMTLHEAEEALFAGGCEAYFQSNYVQESMHKLQRLEAGDELRAWIRGRIGEPSGVGIFAVADWTDEKSGTGSIIEAVQSRIRDLAGHLDSERSQLAVYYEERVEEQPFTKRPLMEKHNVRSFIRYFFETVYQRKLEILLIETELKLYRRYEAELVRIHEEYKHQASELINLQDTLLGAARASICTADDYIGQNIMEYYGVVTEEWMRELESRRGEGVFFEERFMGNFTELLDHGRTRILERLVEVCRKELLEAEALDQTFEEELLNRANVTTDYNNRQVLSKEELFKKLYRTLEDHAVINVRLLEYTQEHRYEEKYFFGDAESEFIRYASSADETSRIYKLGVVHEKRSSGVEKLNIMGGFHLEDLMYYRNGRVYYETYVQNGYEFHGIEAGRLPELR